ncbi:hypothetical protein EW026_g7984 [Hermanssonia centrifuga]|uniref:Uncharacterized protein n=1 Tax=Hermanssonia centrifuga TaxID=98765 RepID=A0A4S4K614_9APHY|nr:hypothetical protein EW026_g7984 [Hermanssonia centrifuga]
MEDPRDPVAACGGFDLLSEPISQVQGDIFDSIIFPSGSPPVDSDFIVSLVETTTSTRSRTRLRSSTLFADGEVTISNFIYSSFIGLPTTRTVREAVRTTQVFTFLATITPTPTPTPTPTSLTLAITTPTNVTNMDI